MSAAKNGGKDKNLDSASDTHDLLLPITLKPEDVPHNRPISQIIIHCSGTPNGQRVKPEDLDSIQVKLGCRRTRMNYFYSAPRLKHCGYHFVVHVEGYVDAVRHLGEVGQHAKGSDENSIGICLIGSTQYTQVQWELLHQLVSTLKHGPQFGGAKRRITHNDPKDYEFKDFYPDAVVMGHSNPPETYGGITNGTVCGCGPDGAGFDVEEVVRLWLEPAKMISGS